MYIEIHGNPRFIRLDLAKCLDGNELKTRCTKKNIQIFEGSVNDDRAIGLV